MAHSKQVHGAEAQVAFLATVLKLGYLCDIGLSCMYLCFDVDLCLESVTCCFLPSCTKCHVAHIM
jgi:hypothetical protein